MENFLSEDYREQGGIWILHVVALRIVDLFRNSGITNSNLERVGFPIFL